MDEIVAAYRRGDVVRRILPGGGELVLERPLPFLVVHRARPDVKDDGTHRIARAEAAHLVLPDASAGGIDVSRLVKEIVEAGVERHGGFLVVELWSGASGASGANGASGTFRIRSPEEEAPAAVRALAEELAELWELHPSLRVEILPTEDRAPPELPPLLTVSEWYRLGALSLGVELPRVYLQPDGQPYPVFFRRFGDGVSRALRRAAFEFARTQAGAEPSDWRALGPREVDPLVWEADRALAEIGAAFDFLLLVAPVNERDAWERFRDSGFSTPPEFRYRLLPIDPDLLKRKLYAIELEKIHDPALAFLLRDRRDELDRKLAMLGDRGAREFLYGSMRLYRPVDKGLLAEAERLLASIAPPAPVSAESRVGAVDFVARAEREFAAYRERDGSFTAEAQIRDDVTGVMVSGGTLLVDEHLHLDPARVEALVQHEVGTHLLTYHNGAAQPLKQLARGLAGYDELQEGLAMVAEYLAGGVTPGRMRVLAARVVAAHCVEGGADFVETFRALRDSHGLGAETAFDVSARAHHAGGFTRDAIYLRGLLGVMRYLRAGGALEPLFAGKLSLRHLDAVVELQERGILRPPVLLPRVLEAPEALARLAALRAGLDPAELVRA